MVTNKGPKVPSMKEIDELCDQLRATLKKLAAQGSTVGIRYKVGINHIPIAEGHQEMPNGTMSFTLEINGGARDDVGKKG